MLAVLVAVAILGLALLIRSFAGEVVELDKPFIIIIGIFFVLYVGAAIFISYQVKDVWSLTKNPFSSSNGYSSEQNIELTDYTTTP